MLEYLWWETGWWPTPRMFAVFPSIRFPLSEAETLAALHYPLP